MTSIFLLVCNESTNNQTVPRLYANVDEEYAKDLVAWNDDLVIAEKFYETQEDLDKEILEKAKNV